MNEANVSSDAVRASFGELLDGDAEKAPALAAIETLYGVLQASGALTVLGLTNELHEAVAAMCTTDHSTISVKSASELFMRFISLTALDHPDFAQCKRVLLERGQLFVRRVSASRAKIVQFCQPFIRDDCRILTHSFSRVVCQALLGAAAAGRSFHVFVTESQPDCSGQLLRHKLTAAHIPCTLILDSAAAYVMETMDFVLLGAEGVVETGGIVNKYSASVLWSDADLEEVHPRIDYTPPQYLKLLFTDLGILTPAAVSDELIKLYL